MIKLHHHPYSRAASVVWMLEEVGAAYELSFVDIMGKVKRRFAAAGSPRDW